MNAQDILHYIITHSEMLIGVSIGLALFTVIFILLLPANKSKQNDIDLSGIEETLKRVIEKIPQGQSAPLSVAGPVSGIQDEEEVAPAPKNQPAPISAPVVDTVALDKLKFEVNEREQKIKALEVELAQAKVVSAKAPAESGSANDDALAKIQELQSKLSEYAIIEEELADISKFKVENARLKLELENIKSLPAAAVVQEPLSMQSDDEVPAAVIAQVEAPTPVSILAPKSIASPELEEKVIDVAPPQGFMQEKAPEPIEEPAPEIKAAIEEPPKALPRIAAPNLAEPAVAKPNESEDQVLRDFQAVVDRQSAPKISVASEVSNTVPLQAPEPLMSPAPLVADRSVRSPLEGDLDTSKMLQEIEKLGDGDGAESDPMADLLDTEKLLAEVRELGGPKNPSEKEQSAVEDLMSEFEAEQQQIKAKA